MEGVPQGFIFGPLLLNVFINGIFIFIKKGAIFYFADDKRFTSYSI